MHTKQRALGILFLFASFFLCGAIQLVSENYDRTNHIIDNGRGDLLPGGRNALPALQTPQPPPLNPIFQWISFVGTELVEAPNAVVTDPSGNLYILGSSHALEYKYNEDPNQIFVTKLEPGGAVAWQVELPAADISDAHGLALQENGNLYVAGTSRGSWGNPIHAYAGERDAFLAELDTDGNLLWNTFLGGESNDSFDDLVVDTNGEIYLGMEYTGELPQGGEAESPVLAKLSSDGSLIWMREVQMEVNSFFYDLAFAPDGTIIAVGVSEGSWGDPIRPYSENEDGFIAKLDREGALVWNTFMGGPGEDDAFRIAFDAEGNIYNCGYSDAAWGQPLNPHTTGFDPYVARTDPDGNLVWQTFVGTAGDDVDARLVLDAEGNLLLAGTSENPWGSPLNPHTGGEMDGFLTSFDLAGERLWNTFIGSPGSDGIHTVIPVDAANLIVVGSSDASFGSPPSPPAGSSDIYAARINLLGELPPAQVQTDGPPYREGGPYVPEITLWIPSPFDISLDPIVVAVNVALAAGLMLPFALAVDLFTRFFSEHEAALAGRFPPLVLLGNLQQSAKRALGNRLRKRRGLLGFLGVAGVIVFYGLVFSLLEPTWNPFTLKGLLLLLWMMIAYGIVGILDDLLQWRMIRKWNGSAELSVQPSNLFLALTSLGISRLLLLRPGLMFGSPEALKMDEGSFTPPQNRTLLLISTLTYACVCLGAWAATIVTHLLKEGSLSQGALDLVSGLEGLLLIIFAVALENVFVQLLGFSEGLGQRIRRSNRWAWGGSLVACTSFFLHTLLNPSNDFVNSLEQGNTALFSAAAASFILLTASLYFISWWRNRRRSKPEPPAASPEPEEVQVSSDS